uniref:Eukaryotic translation initiation factor 2A n=1 Tax=Branchiostoma floridae TaxID=7739 RepID=C3Y7T1_BRAFL|eukprot:XP_002607576.1 hypothetical protein BRAFLDRAFT_119727 [Branchiostoma floridae]
MADTELQSGVSKAAKKNQKRRNKKPTPGEGQRSDPADPAPADPLEALKIKLVEAKAKQDHPLASKLRQQIWLLQDDAAGVRPELDPQILTSLETNLPKSSEKKADVEEKPAVSADSTVDKQLKSLRKKLQQIEKLKQRKAGGEKLEANQMAKVEKEQEVRDEIEEIEVLMRQAALGLL